MSSQPTVVAEPAPAPVVQEPAHKKSDSFFDALSDMKGLTAAFVFIFLSELGDKTFMYIIVSANQMGFLKILILSNIALGGMHVLGSTVGNVLGNFISIFYLKLISIILFLGFGLALIYEGLTEEDDDEDVYTKLENVKSEMVHDTKSQGSKPDLEKKEKEAPKTMWQSIKDCVLAYQGLTFVLMVLAAEMGDMSQISAVILSTTYGYWTVVLGGVAGHFLAIVIALICGKLLMQFISEKALHIVGGLCFISFCAYEAYTLMF